MASIQYYDPISGLWLESCQEGTPCSYSGAALAPTDAQGFHGMQGTRWDGERWVEHVAVDPKLAGVEFEGVMCSATAADQAGLVAVLMDIQTQGAAFEPTRFEFENGNTLVITLANYQAFAAVWRPFRRNFFKVTP